MGPVRKKILLFLSYLLVAALASSVTFALVPGQPQRPDKLQELEKLIEERFIGEADPEALEDAAADAMVKATGDRWSYYIPASEYQLYQEQMQNAYVGVGVTIQADEESGGYLIAAVTEGGSAQEAGIQVGDLLIFVNDEDIRGTSTEHVRNLVRGKKGTTVKLGLLRLGQAIYFDVERRQVLTPVATFEMLSDHIGYITINNFDSRCADECIQAIETLLKNGATKLIFDVRNNPGGYANELVELLDYLLPVGDLFRMETYDGKQSVDKSDKNYLDVPMAVLVNEDSYSAAEFFAAALQEYEAAVVVGAPTVGKGYFQNTFQFSDGSAVSLSVGRYFTPKGVSLAEAGGLTPDVICTVDEETAAKIYYGTLAHEEDPQLQAAIEALKKR